MNVRSNFDVRGTLREPVLTPCHTVPAPYCTEPFPRCAKPFPHSIWTLPNQYSTESGLKPGGCVYMIGIELELELTQAVAGNQKFKLERLHII
jgi:hypothetical protein